MAKKPGKREKSFKNIAKGRHFNLFVLVLAVVFFILVIVFRIGSFEQKETSGVLPTGSFSTPVDEEGASRSLPEYFPSDFPIYSDLTIENSWVSDSENTYAMSVVFRSGTGADQLLSFYKSSMEQVGWNVKTVSENSSSRTLSFNKNDVSGFMGIAAIDGGSVVSVTLGINKDYE